MTEVNEVNFSSGGGMAEGEGGGLGKIIKMAIIGIVVLGVLAGIGIGAWMFFKAPSSNGEGKAGLPANTGQQGRTYLEKPQYLKAGSFVVNLDGRRYLKTNIEFVLSEEDALKFLVERLSEVKDLIITELQNSSTEDLRNRKQIEELKFRLMRKIGTLFPPDRDIKWDDKRPIKRVVFTEFYLQ